MQERGGRGSRAGVLLLIVRCERLVGAPDDDCLLAEAELRHGLTAASVRACHFHEKLCPRLAASSFHRRWPSVSIPRDLPRLPQGQKHSDRALLLAELRHYLETKVSAGYISGGSVMPTSSRIGPR